MARNTQRGLNIDQSTQDPNDPEFSLLVPEKKKVIEAIKKLKYRVTPPELASTSGLPTDKSAFWLNKIAGETKGKLEVAADGTIYYSFKPNFTDAYLQRGMRRAALVVGFALFQFLYWIIRMSFGVALIASLLAIVAIIIALICAAMGNSDSDGPSFDWIDLRFVVDLFAWNYSPGVSYYANSVASDRRNQYGAFVQDHPKGNFFLEAFSFLFGDGAPNNNLEQIRWQQIARVIKENGGVVSTEQLAPYLDGDRSDSGKIMSALAQFNGKPHVTKSGYIVYVFPDFLVPGDAPALPNMRSEEFLQEEKWKFSAFPPEAITTVLVLAVLNFVGSWWLFKHIASVTMLHGLAVLIDILLGYAVVFLAIPAIRWVVLQVLNQRIEHRNALRKKAWLLIAHPEGDVAEELHEAKQVRMEELDHLTADRTIIYDSDRDILDQQFDNPENIQAKPDKSIVNPLRPESASVDDHIIDLKKKQKDNG